MKKSAVAGAIVWSAPVLMSTPAFAASAQCSGSKPCTTWYYAKSTNGSCGSQTGGDGSDEALGGNGCVNLLDNVGCPGKPVTTFADACALLLAAGPFTHDGDSATVTFPANSVPLFIQIKPGPNCYTYQWDGTKFVFYAGTNGSATQPPSTCLIGANADGSIPVTKANEKITVSISWDNGSVCNGISHFNAYFCL